MKTSVINLKVDPKVKALAQKRAKKLGIPLSQVLAPALRDFASGKAVQVEFPAEPMTPQMEKIIENAEKEIAAGEVSPAFTSMDEAIDWLNDPEARLENDNKV